MFAVPATNDHELVVKLVEHTVHLHEIARARDLKKSSEVMTRRLNSNTWQFDVAHGHRHPLLLFRVANGRRDLRSNIFQFPSLLAQRTGFCAFQYV